MPAEILAQTQAGYSDALTLGPSTQIRELQWIVSAPNAAIYQLAKIDDSGKPYWDSQELTAQPGTQGYTNNAGVRFRSSGITPTTILGIALFVDDPVPRGFQSSSVIFDLSGKVT